MAEKRYRVGIIGRTGRGNYGHGLDVVWKELSEHIDVVAVADDGPGLQAAQERTGAAQAFSDFQKMLESCQLDIVAICPRWIDAHHQLALAACEHGCHIYMEKPFCRTLREADEIVRAAEMRHLKIAVAHTNRYSPILRTVRRLISEGAIGQLLELRARGKEDRRGGGEDLWVLGTHMLDLMRVFGADPQQCTARVLQDGQLVSARHVSEGNEGIGPLAGDAVDASYLFPDGVIGAFGSHRNQAASPSRFGLQILGTAGIIQMQSGFLKPASLLQDPSWSPGRSGSEWKTITSQGVDQAETGGADSHHAANHAAVLDLLEAIETDREPISSAHDARWATEMIVGVFESHRLRQPVELPLANRENPLAMLRE